MDFYNEQEISDRSEDYLCHHGVKGMKWGIRKDRYKSSTISNKRKTNSSNKSKQNKNYSDSQRKRDQVIYSKGAVRRINKRMNNGESISSARSKEADRIKSTRSAARYAGTAGRTIGAVAGGLIAGYLSYKGSLKISGLTHIDNPQVRMAISSVIGIGVSKASGQLGADIGRSAVMKSRGYSSKKYR